MLSPKIEDESLQMDICILSILLRAGIQWEARTGAALGELVVQRVEDTLSKAG